MANLLNDYQIEEIVKSIIDSDHLFSIYNDDRNTRIWVQSMGNDEIKKCTEQLNEILLPLLAKPYTIWIDIKPDDSDF